MLKNIRGALLPLVGIIVYVGFCCRGTAAMRLGIVADSEFADNASVLTAELSKSPETYELLERDAVDSVIREQGIARAGATATDWEKAGHLLAADGLLLLQHRKIGENKTVPIGWILSANTGVILGVEVLPEDRNAQLALMKALLERCRAKMEVKAGEAVPVSIVPAEEAAYNQDGQTREIFHNGLMLRLMQDPAIFVLQREQMETLLFERDFAGVDKRKFWAGANVVRSRVGKDPLDPGTLVASLSLKRIDGATETWTERGKTPGELSNAAAVSLRQRLKLSSPDVAYDPTKELAWFHEKFIRMSKTSDVYRPYTNFLDTAITLQALGDKDCYSQQVACYVPIMKACGTFRLGKLQDQCQLKQVNPKAFLCAARDMMELENLRLKKQIQARKPLDQEAVTNSLTLQNMFNMTTLALSYGVRQKDPGLAPELTALRQTVTGYIQTAWDAGWYAPSAFILTHGEFFYDDPNVWLDRVEAIFRLPYAGQHLYFASEWILHTDLEVPRSQEATLFLTAPYDYNGQKAKPDPNTIRAVLPRLEQWAASTNPGLRLAAARILMFPEVAAEAHVDCAKMARAVVGAMDEMVAPYCKTKWPFNPFHSTLASFGFWRDIHFWLAAVDPQAHRELLDLSVHTLALAEKTDGCHLFTQPASKEEAALLGKAYLEAGKRLGCPIRDPDFNAPKRAYPEAFTEPLSAAPVVRHLPQKTARMIWNSKEAMPECNGEITLTAGPSECEGKLWGVLSWREKNDRPHVSLLAVDVTAGTQSSVEIPLPNRERFTGSYFGRETLAAPSHLFVDNAWLFTGPFGIKGNPAQEAWMLLDRKRGSWKEVDLPSIGQLAKDAAGFQQARLMVGDKVYWPFSVDHPQKANGIVEVDASLGTWKFHPCEGIREVFFPYLVWNRERNTLIFMSGKTDLAEFDVKSGKWFDGRPTSAGEAILIGEKYKTAPEPVVADANRDIHWPTKVEADTAVGTWNVETIDPATMRRECFSVNLDVRGASLDPMEKQSLHPTGDVSRALEGGRARSGIWLRLASQRFTSAPFKLFWISWQEIRRDMPPATPRDLMLSQNGLFSMDSAHQENIFLELERCDCIRDSRPAVGTILVEASRPKAFLWGRRDIGGSVLWKAVPMDHAGTASAFNSFTVLSPDGMGVRFITGDEREIYEWRSENNTQKAIFTAPDGEIIRNFAYTGDGAVFAWAGKDKLYWQTATGISEGFPAVVEKKAPMRWSPDGRFLIVPGQNLVLERTETGFRKGIGLTGGRYTWTPDSTQIISTTNRWNPSPLQVTTVADGNTRSVVPQFACGGYSVSIDGKTLWATGYFTQDTGKKCLLKISLANGSFEQVSSELNGINDVIVF